MRIVVLLIAVGLIGFIASRQLKSTVSVPQAVTLPTPVTPGAEAPNAPRASAAVVPITQAPKAVGDAAAAAVQQGAVAAEDKLKAAEGK